MLAPWVNKSFIVTQITRSYNRLRMPTADRDSIITEIASLRGQLTLPRPRIHVISDIHGEYKKLRHVINNASGRLRPFVERLIDDAEERELLSVLYYPSETMLYLREKLQDRERRQKWVQRTLELQFHLIRHLRQSFRRSDVAQLIAERWRELFNELMSSAPREEMIAAMLDALAENDQDLSAVRAASHLVRNLSTAELIVAGDLGDRGERLDRVINYLMRQPNVSIVWGNHDASWMGACLGQEACIATVLRFSVRYNRIAQLEEGYGISFAPLEKLARDVYGNDPATPFAVKGASLDLARMQKAIAIIQLKCEAHTSRRHPAWKMEDRNLLHRINRDNWTIEIDDKVFPLLDHEFPTINWDDPYALSPAEHECMDKLCESFLASSSLWNHMSWVVRTGSMWTRRDDVLIFHACLPLDQNNRPLYGREKFDEFTRIIKRCYSRKLFGTDKEADWFWYLWASPESPLFGKDKMATFEGYFIADKSTHEEKKNAYFQKINDTEFVKMIGRMFGMGDDVLLVNGHVPVKIDSGEEPVKRGGNAVTIDGAFSEAYGDKGYTLLIEPEGISLAEHGHFESVEDVIARGNDMVPKMELIRSYPHPRKIADTYEGVLLAHQICDLQNSL